MITEEAIQAALDHASKLTPSNEVDLSLDSVNKIAATANSLAYAFTLSRQGYQSEQVLRVQEQNRADRIQVQLDAEAEKLADAVRRYEYRARTIIITRTAMLTPAENAAAEKEWIAKGKNDAYYPSRGGYWQVEEDGKFCEGLAVEEATHAVLQLMVNAQPDRMRLRSIDELENSARETGKRMGKREAERDQEAVTYTPEHKPETKPKADTDPQDNDARYSIITMAVAGILKDFGSDLTTDDLIQINVSSDWMSHPSHYFLQRGYSPYNAATLRFLSTLLAANFNASRREWEKGDKPEKTASERPDLVTAKGEGVTLKTRPRNPDRVDIQAAFCEQDLRRSGYTLIGVDLAKSDDTSLAEQCEADMQAARRGEVERLKKMAPPPAYEPDKSGSVE